MAEAADLAELLAQTVAAAKVLEWVVFTVVAVAVEI
jgi:hypothetical protein